MSCNIVLQYSLYKRYYNLLAITLNMIFSRVIDKIYVLSGCQIGQNLSQFKFGLYSSLDCVKSRFCRIGLYSSLDCVRVMLLFKTLRYLWISREIFNHRNLPKKIQITLFWFRNYPKRVIYPNLRSTDLTSNLTCHKLT